MSVGLVGQALSLRLSLVLALASTTTVAIADDAPAKTSPKDAAAAEALFEEGRKMLAAGRVRQACPKFAESYRLDPALGSLLNLATCHQLEGKTASAWGEFRDAEQQARRAGDDKRQRFAADRAAGLEPTLPKLLITVTSPPPGFVVERDGIPLGEGSFNTPLPIDPGSHTIRARAPGYRTWESQFDARSKERSSVVVPELERDAGAPSDPGAIPGDGSQPPPAAKEIGAAGAVRTVGFVVGATGLASLAAGGVFALLFFDKDSQADACAVQKSGDPCWDAAIGTRDTYGTLSGVTLGVGAVALVAGIFLVVTSGGEEAPPQPATTTWRLSPYVGPDGASMTYRATF